MVAWGVVSSHQPLAQSSLTPLWGVASLSFPSLLSLPSGSPCPTPTSSSLPEPGWNQAVRAIGRERKPKGAGGGGDTGSEMVLLPHPPSPQPCSQRREVGGGGSGRAPTNRQSQPFPGGPRVRPPPRSICLCHSLCHPACQPSPTQQAGIPGRASPGSARGGSRLQSGVLLLCFTFPYLLIAFGALVFPNPEAPTPSCASLWLSRPSLHLCHHLPRVSCQLWAQGASDPVSLRSCTLPPHPRAEGWQPQHLEGLALCSGYPGRLVSHPVPYPPSPPPFSPVTTVLFPPLCLLPAPDSLLPSRPWLEAHNETASPHRLGGRESPWQPRKPLLPLLPLPLLASPKGLEVWWAVLALMDTGWRMTGGQG